MLEQESQMRREKRLLGTLSRLARAGDPCGLSLRVGTGPWSSAWLRVEAEVPGRQQGCPFGCGYGADMHWSQVSFWVVSEVHMSIFLANVAQIQRALAEGAGDRGRVRGG